MKTILTLTAGTLLFLGSCTQKEAATKAPIKNEPIPVQINKNNITATPASLTTSGKIEAIKAANISTRMMGIVSKIHTKIGASVQKGDLLLSIQNTDLQAKKTQINSGIQEATAAFENAKRDYERFQKLFEQQSTSQKEMDDMTTRYSMAKARLATAKAMQTEINAQLEYALLKAPFNGTITNKYIEVGNMANPGMPLLEIEDTQKFQVITPLPESEISSISLETEVTVLVKALNKKFKGTIAEISSSSKNSGGQYLVKIVVDKQPEILSGMYANVQFFNQHAKTNTSVYVPKSALITRGQLTGIYTISDYNTAILRWVRLGKTNKNTVEILSGLHQNEKYIVSASEKLYNGANITIQ